MNSVVILTIRAKFRIIHAVDTLFSLFNLLHNTFQNLIINGKCGNYPWRVLSVYYHVTKQNYSAAELQYIVKIQLIGIEVHY